MKISKYLNSTASYDEKIARACKELPIQFLVAWAADCAESVLHIFEQEYPGDKRPRQAIEAARSGDANAVYAAYAAAHAANAAAHAAANAAAHAAANAAFASCAAFTSCAAAHAAAGAAYAVDAASIRSKQMELNVKLLLKYVEITDRTNVREGIYFSHHSGKFFEAVVKKGKVKPKYICGGYGPEVPAFIFKIQCSVLDYDLIMGYEK